MPHMVFLPNDVEDLNYDDYWPGTQFTYGKEEWMVTKITTDWNGKTYIHAEKVGE